MHPLFDELQYAYEPVTQDKVASTETFINGRDLNEMLCTDEYDSNECYIVDSGGIRIFNCE